jgi:hypothetical protein
VYRTCIFCSAPLGANEAVEAFPVGKSLAFDAARGRLWAVCPRCARWNLAPIQERWEAVEEAERHFRDARLRAQSENVGLARLPDGTRLVRVGQALPGELAAWRYGDQLVRRRRQYQVAGAVLAGAAAVGLGAGMALTTLSVAGAWQAYAFVGRPLWRYAQGQRVVARIRPDETPTGEALLLRRKHLRAAELGAAPQGGGIELRVARVDDDAGFLERMTHTIREQTPIVFPDAVARKLLGRAMVHVNSRGASHDQVQGAVQLLTGAPTPEEYLRRVAERGHTLTGGSARRSLVARQSLAVEMALHEETERRALEGELAALEAAWREAEEIAAIADVLPDDPLHRLKGA